MLGYSSSAGSSRPLPAPSLFLLQTWTSQLSCHKAAKPCCSYWWEREAQTCAAKGRKGMLWSQWTGESCEHLQHSPAQPESPVPGYHQGEAAPTEVTLLSAFAQFVILNLRPWPCFLFSVCPLYFLSCPFSPLFLRLHVMFRFLALMEIISIQNFRGRYARI